MRRKLRRYNPYKRNTEDGPKRINIGEASARLKKVKDALNLTIPKLAELLDVPVARVRTFLYQNEASRAGYKNAPAGLVETAEALIGKIAPARHRNVKATKEEVIDALKKSKYRKVAASKLLGINSSTINKLISSYEIQMPSAGRDAGYGFIRRGELSPKQRLRHASEIRARKLGKKLYTAGKVYSGPVPGKGRSVKARHYYIAVAPRSLITFDPRTEALRLPNMSSKPYEDSEKTPYEALRSWKVSVDAFNSYVKQEEFDLVVTPTYTERELIGTKPPKWSTWADWLAAKKSLGIDDQEAYEAELRQAMEEEFGQDLRGYRGLKVKSGSKGKKYVEPKRCLFVMPDGELCGISDLATVKGGGGMCTEHTMESERVADIQRRIEEQDPEGLIEEVCMSYLYERPYTAGDLVKKVRNETNAGMDVVAATLERLEDKGELGSIVETFKSGGRDVVKTTYYWKGFEEGFSFRRNPRY